ncbi:hypothetical protein E1A91_D12G303800v1 [Gossypium mustelinum]|uniref:Protein DETOXIFICATION n=1 Tax=Gossypium mustelinum TaxID=34275 RepID=A0A5D2SKR4_GOSMU|nr:hypothetical protein E1A91_D12G303800v1 [Gossypium mustelinum]
MEPREDERSLISFSSPLEDSKEKDLGKEEIIEEVKKQLWLAAPLICESLLLYCLQLISVMFVGHLGALALASASLATSFAAVLAFNLLMGMSTALETLCGQSYGAKQYHMLGTHTQRAMLILSLITIPLAIILANTGSILSAVGQDPEISRAAGVYACYMIPTLFAYAILQCLLRFLRTQNNIFPMVLSSGITTLIHVFICWILVFKLSFGNKGAALAGSISLESWSFQILVFLSGLLPNPELETSVITICINTTAIILMIPFGLSSAASIRVSNELGAEDPKGARLAARVALVLGVSEGILVGLALVLMRNVLGYAYSNDASVIRYVSTMVPILAASNIIDGVQCVLSGALAWYHSCTHHSNVVSFDNYSSQ